MKESLLRRLIRAAIESFGINNAKKQALQAHLTADSAKKEDNDHVLR